jgi:CheY-like chemotaxis protein
MTRITILVVEDEFITATDLRTSLKEMGYDVPVVVDNGEEAIRKAGELQPSLVLMDIGLSGKMNGIEAGRQIRERFGIPVLYLTAHSDESTFWSALGSEPCGYIIKPFEARELKFNIEMALHKNGRTHPAGKDLSRETGEGDPGGAASAGARRGKDKARSSMTILRKVTLVCLVICVVLLLASLYQLPRASPAKETRYEKNVQVVREIARGYYDTHTYLGVQTGQSADIYVCLDMAKDVWNMVKTRGINAVIQVGNVKQNITTIGDANHAWVLAEVGPMQWLAVETTSGLVVTRDENPRYYAGMQFDSPAGIIDYACGRGYCWSNTCVDDQCLDCSPGFVLGTDIQCHPGCGSTYCKGNGVCVNGQCMMCNNGEVAGTDNQCHPACIDASHYCLTGYVCGPDNKCHPEQRNAT